MLLVVEILDDLGYNQQVRTDEVNFFSLVLFVSAMCFISPISI